MNFWRYNRALKTGLFALFTFLMCSQSFATPSGAHIPQSDVAVLLSCIGQETHQSLHCLTTQRHAQENTSPRDSAPAQHSHESEIELEEKGEKELEDDKEEMDRDGKASAFAFNSSLSGNNRLAVTFCAGPIRDVPTPPPNA